MTGGTRETLLVSHLFLAHKKNIQHSSSSIVKASNARTSGKMSAICGSSLSCLQGNRISKNRMEPAAPMEPAPPMEPPPAHLLPPNIEESNVAHSEIDDEVAHSFAYIRWNERERNIRLFRDGSVSYDRKERHGYWEYWWDATSRKGVFAIHFNARPANQPKRHEFHQIGETSAYRYRAATAEWTAIIVHDLECLLREREASQSSGG